MNLRRPLFIVLAPTLALGQPAPLHVAIRASVARGVAVSRQELSAAVLSGLTRGSTRRIISVREDADFVLHVSVRPLSDSDLWLTVQRERGPIRGALVPNEPPASRETLLQLAESLAVLQAWAAPEFRPSSQARTAVARRWVQIHGLHFGGPAKLSATWGAAFIPVHELGPGFFATVEPGARAGRVTVGYTRITGNLATGTATRATLLRRYGGLESRTYVGVEGQLNLVAIGPRVGLFWPVSGTRRAMLTIDLAYLL